MSVSEEADERQRAQQREDKTWEPFVDKRGKSNDPKVPERLAGRCWVVVHGVEEGYVWQNARVVHLGWANENVTVETSEAVSNHLRREEE